VVWAGACALGLWSAVAVAAPAGKTLDPHTRFLTPQADQAGIVQTFNLALEGQLKNAAELAALQLVPRGVWLDGGTPAAVTKLVSQTLLEARLTGTVPLFVLYNIPGRDCGGYSAGGAETTADYEAWVNAIASTIGNAEVVVALEPDALANLPQDCGYDTDGSLTTNRYLQLGYALGTLEQLPRTSVYLDAGHSAWHSVGDMAQRLVAAQTVSASLPATAASQGFFLNASNYQPTPQEIEYGTWISKCIYYVNNPATPWTAGMFGWCASQYYPATAGDFCTWPLTDAWYTANVDDAANPPSGPNALTHFIIDTSRNGKGPNNMSIYGQPPYSQSPGVVSTLASANWCNPPGSGAGLRPTADVSNPTLDASLTNASTCNPLTPVVGTVETDPAYASIVDALLWIKTPGESDGTCDSQGGARAWDYTVYTQPGWPTTAAAQATFDPLWGLVDPAAGIWFPQQALQLAQLATPPLL
jgi:endoglucanase